MKTIISALMLLYLLAQAASAQVTKKTFDLSEFKSIYVNSNYTVYLKQTNKQEVTVETQPDILTASEILVENGILMINIKRETATTNKNLWQKLDDIKLNPTMNVYISMKNISELQVNGGGKIISENSIASNNIILGVNGSGSMDIDLKGEEIKAEVTGSGSMAIRGYASTLNALLSGSGSLSAFNCPIDNATVKLSGSGTCELNVTNNIDAVVMGSGQIKHKGNTKNTQKKVYGNGDVARAF